MNPNHEEERADERLDEMLGQWAEQTSAPERVADLQQRILEAADEAVSHTPKLNGRRSHRRAASCTSAVWAAPSRSLASSSNYGDSSAKRPSPCGTQPRKA